MMKAAVFNKPNELVVTEREIPELEYGESLIKVRYVGICGTDLHVFHGQHATATYPRIPGHEFIGELVEVKGKGRERFKKNDIVVAQEIISCGSCDACAKGANNVCTSLEIIGVHADGGFATYVKVPTERMYKLPHDIDLKLGSLVEPLAVAVHDVRRSGLQVGETAFVAGGGPIGLLIALVAREAGATEVVVSEVNPGRKEFAKSLGFTVVDPTEDTFEADLKRIHKGRLFDVCYEAAGAPGVMQTCIGLAKPSGTVVVIAIPSKAEPLDTFEVFAKELTLVGVRIHSQFNFIGAIDMVKSGKINEDLQKFISKTFPLNEIDEAFEYLENEPTAMKVLIEI